MVIQSFVELVQRLKFNPVSDLRNRTTSASRFRQSKVANLMNVVFVGFVGEIKLTQEIKSRASICEPSGRHVSVKLAPVRRMVRFGEGHEVVVVARISEGISEDEERRNINSSPNF